MNSRLSTYFPNRHRIAFVALLALLTAAPLQGETLDYTKKKPHRTSNTTLLEGLSVTVDAGLFIANDKQANFYCGRPEVPNTIERVLHSQAYGQQIWTSLKNQGYLQGISSYSEITLADYPEMYYKLSYLIGLGFRYDYASGWGWLARFSYSQLTAAGAFHINNKIATGTLTNQGRYITCGMYGLENRIFIDAALSRRFPLGNNLELEFDLGFNFNNTKVREQKMEIGGQYYNVLNVWDSDNLYTGVASYEYINQGSVGIGGLVSASISYVIPTVGSLDLGYTFYYNQTVFTEYNKDDAYAPNHVVSLRINLNNFSFFGNN